MYNYIYKHDSEKWKEALEFICNIENTYNPFFNFESKKYLFTTLFDENSCFITRIENNNIICCAHVTLSHSHQDALFFGQIESINQDYEQNIKNILKEIEEFSKRSHRSTIYGPIQFNTWFSNRIKVNYENEILNFEPQHDKRLLSILEANGFVTAMNYYTYFHPDSQSMKYIEKYIKIVEDNGFCYEKIDINKVEHKKTLYELNCKCFNENYLYEEISYEQYEKTHLLAIKNQDLSLSFFVKKGDTYLGYLYAFMNDDSIVIKTSLTIPEARSNGLATYLIAIAGKIANEQRGSKKIIGALIREDNISASIFSHTPDSMLKTQYKILKKDIR